MYLIQYHYTIKIHICQIEQFLKSKQNKSPQLKYKKVSIKGNMAGVEGIEPSSKVLETSILTVGRHPYEILIYISINFNVLQYINQKNNEKY